MLNKIMGFFQWIFMATLVVGVSYVWYVSYLKPRPVPAPSEDTIYYTRFGGVYCGYAEYTQCGAHLWLCGDDREYFCVTDLAVKKVKNEAVAN